MIVIKFLYELSVFSFSPSFLRIFRHTNISILIFIFKGSKKVFIQILKKCEREMILQLIHFICCNEHQLARVV